MKARIGEDKSKSDNLGWVFLAEYSLGELFDDAGQRKSLIHLSFAQFLREMGIPLECLDTMEATIIGFINQSIARIIRDTEESPEYIRIFCQRKAFEQISLLKASNQFTEEQVIDPKRILHDSAKKTIGGLGYFLVERKPEIRTYSGTHAYNLVDLYIYNEGD